MDNKGTFNERLRKAMNIRGLTQKDLVDKTGFSKSRISQYVNGTYEAKQDGVYKLSKALDVNEAWLMGYDCPMDRCAPNVRDQNDSERDQNLSELLNIYQELSDEGQQALLVQARFMLTQYKKKPRLSRNA